jgi:fatty-acyl-CoA synthase
VPSSGGHYDAPHLAKNAANFVALTPLSFLSRAAAAYPDKLAIVHGAARFTYRELYTRCCRLADALRRRGVARGDTVTVMAPNVPALLEAHYGVPMAGAVLNALNYRLDARSIAFILAHGEAKLLIADREFAPIVAEALREFGGPMPVVEIDDGVGASLGGTEYEALLAEGDPAAAWSGPDDEWEPIALNYTSGTTGNPKGVVYHHRGAFLNAIGNAITFGLDRHSVYLWTLPMFHCNGWTYPWAVTAAAGTHVCLRRVGPAPIFAAIAEHRVTHLCGAPIVLNMLVHAPETAKRRFDHVVEVATGGAAPPSAVIQAMERMGFRVTHLYGLTESCGPSTVCAWQEEWAGLPVEERAARMARQGVASLTVDRQPVVDPQTMTDVPADAGTLGEVVLRTNTLMKGYLKNPAATAAAFEHGWFHTGDLAVRHPDGYVEVKDRSKDIIISGGENISSLEVEDALYRHPQVMEAAVVAPGAAPASRITKCRERSCSGHCPRPRPGKSRNSSCASAPRKSRRDASAELRPHRTGGARHRRLERDWPSLGRPPRRRRSQGGARRAAGGAARRSSARDRSRRRAESADSLRRDQGGQCRDRRLDGRKRARAGVDPRQQRRRCRLEAIV